MPNWAYNEIYARTREDFEKLKECVLNNDEMDFNRIIPMPHELDDIPADHRDIDRFAYLIGDGDPVDRIMVCDYIKSKYPQVVFTSNGQPVTVKLDGTLTEDALDTSNDHVFFSMAIVDQIIAKSQNIDKKQIAEMDARALKSPKSPINNGLTWKQTGAKALNALITYGTTNWYDWATSNWGTKWNAGETLINEESMSIYFQTAWSPVDELIGKLSAKTGLSLYMEYSEEQFSAFAGEVVYVNGQLVDSTEEEHDGFDLYRIAAHMQDPDEEFHRYSEDMGIIADYSFGDENDDDYVKLDDIPRQDDLTSPMYYAFMNGDYELATLAKDDA